MEDIYEEWKEPTSRQISLSGLGGVGKTELSIAMVEKLGPIPYVLWLRASDDTILQQDLVRAARDLRNELLRFEHGDNRSSEHPSTAALYFSGVTETDLVSILERWVKVIPKDESQILVVLDDLDGLDSSHHNKYSLIFSGDALRLIYTTRDPSMADDGMLWEAVNFDVPSLGVDEAVNVLEHLSRDRRSVRGQATKILMQHSSSLEHDNNREIQMKHIVTCLGTLPAAITIGSHYIKDNFGSKRNPDSYNKFLDAWSQDGGKKNVLNSRRAMLKYHQSLLSSFELSLQRLRRNVKNIASHDKFEQHCLILLQLFSAMNLDEISENDLSKFKKALRISWNDLQGLIREAEFSDLLSGPQALDREISIDKCVTELVKVSLLTEPSSDGTRLLNNVTKACALLVPTKISADEVFALDGSAKEVWKHWDRDDTKLLNELDLNVLEPDTRNGKKPSMESMQRAPSPSTSNPLKENHITSDQKSRLPEERRDDFDDDSLQDITFDQKSRLSKEPSDDSDDDSLQSLLQRRRERGPRYQKMSQEYKTNQPSL